MQANNKTTSYPRPVIKVLVCSLVFSYLIGFQLATKQQSRPCKILAFTFWKEWRTAPQKNCWPTVGQQSADCRPTVGSMSVICWPSVGWEPLSNTRKASARREEHCISTRNETFSLESAILFRFFRDQSPRNLLCLGFLGTKPLTIPLHHPRSQEAKNLFTAASCSFFFCFTMHFRVIS